MTNREHNSGHSNRPEKPSILLACKNISRTFAGIEALSDVTLEFPAGRVTAILGPNGAGKTTLFNILDGTIAPTGGTVLYKDRNITGLAPWKVGRLGIGRLFQELRLFSNLTALENMLVADPGLALEGPLAALTCRRAIGKQRNQVVARSAELLTRVGLGNKLHSKAAGLSFGQQKLLAIARMLAMKPQVVLADEPTAGVHPEIGDRLIQILKGLAGTGVAVVVIEHNLDVVHRIADWTYLLAEGRVVAQGPPAAVLMNPDLIVSLQGSVVSAKGHIWPRNRPVAEPSNLETFN